MKTAVREQVNAMDAAAYFKLFAELLKTNPPAADDAPMVDTTPAATQEPMMADTMMADTMMMDTTMADTMARDTAH